MIIPPPPVDRERPASLAEEREKTVVDNPHTGLAIAAPDGKFLETNERFQSLVGYSGEELRRMTVFEVTHPDALITPWRAADAIRYGNSRTSISRSGISGKAGGSSGFR